MIDYIISSITLSHKYIFTHFIKGRYLLTKIDGEKDDFLSSFFLATSAILSSLPPNSSYLFIYNSTLLVLLLWLPFWSAATLLFEYLCILLITFRFIIYCYYFLGPPISPFVDETSTTPLVYDILALVPLKLFIPPLPLILLILASLTIYLLLILNLIWFFSLSLSNSSKANILKYDESGSFYNLFVLSWYEFNVIVYLNDLSSFSY